ncbi:response regulator transcription factor [Olivibacter sp. SDN3]|uniref:response regulator n=1 Tax=Olivibacter sp. SDN3 TaxID=2764720 RepID=UPI001651656D|nr:response regulator transcription factor [Olivibacter sp. SDN3]QNL49628.1 response regulator transcription factor [Olivibacter sp. SDN3]
MIKTVIIDDHPIVIDGLKNLFSSSPEIALIGSYKKGYEALEALPHLHAEVVLLDINLPDVNGISLCAEISKQFPQIKIIALSLHNEHAVIRSMLQQGAVGYVIKNAPGNEILEAIRVVASNQQYLCTATKIAMENAEEAHITIPLITRREKEVLHLIGKGLTTQQVADQLFISPHTVESHRKKLMEKFEVNNIISVIKLATDYRLL